jgi:hypothetical protein
LTGLQIRELDVNSKMFEIKMLRKDSTRIKMEVALVYSIIFSFYGYTVVSKDRLIKCSKWQQKDLFHLSNKERGCNLRRGLSIVAIENTG